MKRSLFIFVTWLVTYSCTSQTDLTLLLSRCDSLENKISSLQHVNDSLLKISKRWEYGRDSHLYSDDFKGGNAMSWRWARSLDQLKFDTDLLDKIKIEVSDNTDYKVESLSVEDIVNNYDLPEHSSQFYVNSQFESDRYNYLISVVYINALNEAVYRVASELSARGETARVNRDYVVDVYAGLIYKKLYNKLYNYDLDKTMKAYSTMLEEEIGREIFLDYFLRH